MDLLKETRFIQLVENQPLTLACSSLADFLWSDFIRETKPSVTYLQETYNIKQLSRFGKEIFERLYQGDDVNWLVTEDAYEEYFKKVCNGDSTAIPDGYKPEDGIWYSIMGDLSEAAAWPQLLLRSVGDQFNSGNNAINILNELAEVIEEAIKEGQFNVELLTNGQQLLEDLHAQFQEAQKKGDQEEMQRIKGEGVQLLQKINESIEIAKQTIQAEAHRIADAALKKHNETNDALNNFYGTTPGAGYALPDLQEKKELAKRLTYNKQLKKLAIKLGYLRKIWAERKRAVKTRSHYESITGAIFSDDITRAFPAEVALAGSKEGKALFALKYAQKNLLTKDFTANQKDLGKGPIILYIDSSGSMAGEPELWSKAITFVIAEHARREKRSIHIYLFDTRVESAIHLKKENPSIKKLLDFVGMWSLGGGTSFNAVINHALFTASVEENADILMITDGHAEVSDRVVNKLNAFKKEMGTQWNTICVKNQPPNICKKFSDEVFSVNFQNTDQTVECIQRCIR